MQTCSLSPHKQFPKPKHSSLTNNQKHNNQNQNISLTNPPQSQTQNISRPIKRVISNRIKIVHQQEHKYKPSQNTPFTITFKLPKNQIPIQHNFKSPITIKQINSIFEKKYINISCLHFYQNQNRLFSEQIISKSTEIRIQQKLIHFQIQSEGIKVLEYKIDCKFLKVSPLDLMNNLCSSNKLQKHRFAYYNIQGQQFVCGLQTIPFNKKVNLILTNHRPERQSTQTQTQQIKQIQTNNKMPITFNKLLQQLKLSAEEHDSFDSQFLILKYRLRKAFQSQDQKTDQTIMRYIKEWLIQKF